MNLYTERYCGKPEPHSSHAYEHDEEAFDCFCSGLPEVEVADDPYWRKVDEQYGAHKYAE